MFRGLRKLTMCKLFSICLASLFSLDLRAGEEDMVLLTIEGNLISKIESLGPSSNFELIINNYYNLLSPEVQAQTEEIRLQLAALIPDYEVAYLAADSAEISEVIDEIDVLWSSLRIIHEQQFTSEVVELLNQAFNSDIPLSGTKLPLTNLDQTESVKSK